MNRKSVFFSILTIVLTLSGCNVPVDKNAEKVSNMLNINSEIKNQCMDFTVQGGRIYFTHMYDNGTLYSINIDGSGMRKLNDDYTPLFYVSGNQIYYQNGSDGSKLYSITTEGKDKRKLSDDQLGTVFWNVYSGRIYYSNEDDAESLYSIKVDGSDRKRLSGYTPLYMDIQDGQIYYYESEYYKRMYRMKTDGSGNMKLSEDKPFGIVTAEDWIYYPNTEDNSKLYAIRLDGSDRHKVSDDYMPSMSIVNNRIYYEKGDDGRIFSVKIDGTDKQLLSDDHVQDFSIWDDRIYYTISGAKIYSMSIDGGDKQLLVDLSSNAYKEVTYEVSDRLHKKMAEYKFVATGKTLSTKKYAVGFVMGMKVFGEKGQLILGADFSEVSGDEVLGNPVNNEMMDTMGLHVVDVNFDGFKDVIILNIFGGAHGNTWYNCWLWDPVTSSLVESKSFTDICNPALDTKKKCIYSSGGSGAEFWGDSIYKYIDGKFVMTNNLDGDSKGLTEKKLVNGKMVVVRKVTYDSGERSEDLERQYYKTNKLWQLDNPRWYMAGGHHSDEWLGGCVLTKKKE